MKKWLFGFVAVMVLVLFSTPTQATQGATLKVGAAVTHNMANDVVAPQVTQKQLFTAANGAALEQAINVQAGHSDGAATYTTSTALEDTGQASKFAVNYLTPAQLRITSERATKARQ